MTRQPSLRVNKENTHDKILRSGKTLPKGLGDRKAGKVTKTAETALKELKQTENNSVVCERRVQPMPKIPEGVPDIDEEEGSNPQLCSEYSPYMYAYLKQLEAKFPIKKDFLKSCLVTGRMRGVLIDWLIEVHQQFKLLQETLYLTVYLIDSYLQADGQQMKRSKFQLLGVTAMFTASKIEEMYAPEINDFVYITDNAYTAADIKRMELKMLSALNFAVTRPIPLHFLRRYSKAGDVDILQHTLAKYLIELSQLEYDMAHISPSLIAAAGLYLSLIATTPDASVFGIWGKSLEYYSSYGFMEVLPTVCKLAAVLKKAGEGKLKTVYSKYCAKKMLSVAELSELQAGTIEQLANKHLNSLK